MRKLWFSFLFLVIFFSFSPTAAAETPSDDVAFFIEDTEYTLTPFPVIENGNVMIPMRAFFELIEVKVEWDGEQRIALAYREEEGEEFDASISHGDALLNGKEGKVSLDTPAIKIDGNIFVPVRFAAGRFGYDVSWDASQRAVLLSENGDEGEGFLGVKEAEIIEDSIEGTGEFMWPVKGGGQISSGYGWRRGRFHSGVDIAASTGTPILASDSGIVIFAGWESGYGNSIVIKHGNYYTRYAHNSTNLVSRGDTVNKGEVIARVGSTGRATGPHLHFEIRLGGKYGSTINPLNRVNPNEG